MWQKCSCGKKKRSHEHFCHMRIYFFHKAMWQKCSCGKKKSSHEHFCHMRIYFFSYLFLPFVAFGSRMLSMLSRLLLHSFIWWSWWRGRRSWRRRRSCSRRRRRRCSWRRRRRHSFSLLESAFRSEHYSFINLG